MKKALKHSLAYALVLLVACGVFLNVKHTNIVNQAAGVIVYELDKSGKSNQVDGRFHGYRIKATKDSYSAYDVVKLIDILSGLIGSNTSNVKLCVFSPDLGVSSRNGSSTIDYLICLTCADCDVYTNNVFGGRRSIDEPIKLKTYMLIHKLLGR